MIGFGTPRSRCTQALINGPLVPHISLWEPCYFATVPDGPQIYTLDVFLLLGAQIRMSEWSQSSHLQRMWAEVSSSAPHLLHWTNSPGGWKCLPRVLCPVRRPMRFVAWERKHFCIGFHKEEFCTYFLFLVEIRWVYPGYYILRLDNFQFKS